MGPKLLPHNMGAITTQWWKSHPHTIPYFGDVPPYRYFAANKRHLYVALPYKGLMLINGGLEQVEDFTHDKVDILRLIGAACLTYWNMSARVRQTNRLPAVAYSVTMAYVDGLIKDLLQPGMKATLDKAWCIKDNQTRTGCFHLTF